MRYGASISSIPIEEFCQRCGRNCNQERKNRIFEEVKYSAYHIIEGKGATYYAVGLAVRRIVEAILRNENSVLPVSSLMKGYYGIEDVCLSLPSIFNDQGLARVLELPLTEEEVKGLGTLPRLKASLRRLGFRFYFCCILQYVCDSFMLDIRNCRQFIINRG